MIPEECVAFAADLLHAPVESVEHRVGQSVWDILGDGSRDDAFEAVTELMRLHEPQSRAFELGYEIWLLLGGKPVAA